MYETFEKLEESKKNQILQVCIEEFAKNGYENTSTNTIVKRLGISKGVLFLYFKSKKNLYLYILDQLTESLTNEFFKRFSDQKGIEYLDIFDHLGEYFNILLQEKPYGFRFMLDAFLNAPMELRDEIDAKHNQAHDEAMKRINMDNFRKGVNPQMIVNMLHMVSYYIGQMIFNEYSGGMDKFKDNVDRYTEAYNQYIKIIKYGVYK